MYRFQLAGGFVISPGSGGWGILVQWAISRESIRSGWPLHPDSMRQARLEKK